MKNNQTHFITTLLLLFFLLMPFFPTIRILTIGTQSAQGGAQMFLSLIPEIAFVAIMLWAIINQLKSGWKLRWHRFDWVVLVFVVQGIVTGAILSGDIELIVQGIRMSYLPIGMYFIASFLELKKEMWWSLLHRIFLSILGLGVIGILLYFVFPGLNMYFLSQVSGEALPEYFIVRMTSVFWTPVVFSSFITVALIYFVYRYFETASRIFLLFIFICSFCLWMSVSRGAILAFITTFILLLVLRKKFRSVLMVLLSCTLSAATVFIYTNNSSGFAKWLAASTAETFQMEQGVSRVELWRQSVELLKEHPQGLGLGKAGHIAKRYESERTHTPMGGAATDGWYLKHALEVGIPGLLIYLVILVLTVVFWFRYYRKHGYDRVSLLFTIGVFVNIQNIVSNVNDFYLFSYLYWLLFGIFVAHLKRSDG